VEGNSQSSVRQQLVRWETGLATGSVCVAEDTAPLSCRKSNPGQVLIWSKSLNSQTISPSQQSATNTSTFQNTILHPWKQNFTNYRGLHSSGMLCSVSLFLFTDISGPPIGPIFKGPAVEIRTEILYKKKTRTWDDLILWSYGDKTNLVSWWRQLAWLYNAARQMTNGFKVSTHRRHTNMGGGTKQTEKETTYAKIRKVRMKRSPAVQYPLETANPGAPTVHRTPKVQIEVPHIDKKITSRCKIF